MIGISNHELLSSLKSLIGQETRITIAVLKHIAEVEERRLYLEEGYSSMYSYLREKFNYSESSAWRRLTAARALRQFPQVCESLACRAINLSTLCQIAKSLTCANCEELLTAVKGKSKDEVSRILVELALPAPGVPSVQIAKAKRDKVKLLAVQKNAPKAVVPDLFSWNRNDESDQNVDEAIPEEHAEFVYKIEFIADSELYSKIQKVRCLLSSRYPQGATTAEILNELAESYLLNSDKAMPRRKVVDEGASVGSESHSQSSNTTSVIATKPTTSEIPKVSKKSRYISKEVRDHVYARDGGCCSFVGRTGRKCGSVWDIEIDHIVPFAAGGTNEPSNLRLLCRAHNQMHAERVFGREFMEQQQTHQCARNGLAEVATTAL